MKKIAFHLSIMSKLTREKENHPQSLPLQNLAGFPSAGVFTL